LPNPCALTDGEEATATETKGMSLPSNSLIKEAAGMLDGVKMECAQPSEREPCMASVRRLTPTECCRLQGFPDGWTHVHGAPMVGDTPLWETLLQSRSQNGLEDES
jgi:site-specific DNA-cytosine methylase